MREIFGMLLLAVLLLGIYRLMLRGGVGNVGRPPRGVWTRLKDPSGAPAGLAAMTSIALASGLTHLDPQTTVTSGAVVGLIVAVAMMVGSRGSRLGVGAWAVELVGIVMAFWELGRFLVGDGQVLSVAYRISVCVALLGSFALGAVVLRRGSAVRGKRGMALFGLVEIVTFLASPSTQDEFRLDGLATAVFVLVVAALAFTLGCAVSEFTLGISALAVITVMWLQQVTVQDANAATVAVVAALVSVLVVGVGARLFSGTLKVS